MKKIAIFCSGSGSNAEKICVFFSKSKDVSVVLIATNNKSAFVIERAKKLAVPFFVFSKKELNSFSLLQRKLEEKQVSHIVLAGFLLKIPSIMIKAYAKKIINIHPSLLPKYGGKGMYGKNVHLAVLNNKEKETGITIHLVNEFYDEGEILFQKKCSVEKKETLSSLSKKVQSLEHRFFPLAIKTFLS